MPSYKIPLLPTPQRFTITLGGLDYQILLTYKNVTEGGWVIDVADNAGVPMLAGIPLVTGTDVLGQHKHLGFGGALSIQPKDTNVAAVPTFTDLGIDTQLIWTTT